MYCIVYCRTSVLSYVLRVTTGALLFIIELDYQVHGHSVLFSPFYIRLLV